MDNGPRTSNIALLGSTGSIGVSTLQVIADHPEHFTVVALAAGTNVELLCRQIERFRPSAAAVLDADLAAEVRRRLPNALGTEIFSGTEGYRHIATMEETDTVISAMSGAAGLLPTHAAICNGKRIALANKETLVMAGALIMSEARRRDVPVLPIDSEHCAVLQCLQGHPRTDLKRVILTASGGPFRGMSWERMQRVTPAEALDHPNWSMGPKITVDSATLMNKGLEVIEAKWLFDLEMEEIAVLIHPQSIIHSMVEFRDGSTIAQLGIPDMRIPIAYALFHPRHVGNPLPPLDLSGIGTLTFEEPDEARFPCLGLAMAAAAAGKSAPAVLNAANEVAVAAFLEKRLPFPGIWTLVEETLSAHVPHDIADIEDVVAADRWAREKAQTLVAR